MSQLFSGKDKRQCINAHWKHTERTVPLVTTLGYQIQLFKIYLYE